LLGLRVFLSAWILVDKHGNANTRKINTREEEKTNLPPPKLIS
jgi:hypothetical protein